MTLSLVGQKFGRLTVLRRGNTYVFPSGQRRYMWTCHCACGNKCSVGQSDLRNGHTKSCGCLRLEKIKTHGKSRTKVYMAWVDMLQRCTNTKNIQYADYGGRGIKACKRWHKFENFYADMGDPPKGKSLDRRDNNGDYEKSNCRWASRRAQQNNRRNSVFVEYKGERKTTAQWARRLGINRQVLNQRLNKLKWSTEKAFTTPVQRNGKPFHPEAITFWGRKGKI